MPTMEELKQLQALPLERKILITQTRLIEWYNRFNGQVYVSFSGGKDSTVLLHIARSLFPDIEAVFSDTGLEFPEIRRFVKGFDNVAIIRPQMRFVEVIKKFGYPFISKEVAERVYNARLCVASGGTKYNKHYNEITTELPVKVKQLLSTGGFKKERYNFSKWKPLLNCDFLITHLCCNEMKKKPLKHLQKKAIVATMTEESMLRQTSWLKTGCNAFNAGVSKPLSFWTEQDVLHYIKKYNLPIASVYGSIVYECGGLQYENSLLGCGKLCTTGCKRTGCMYCAFGAQRDERFAMLKKTHKKQYDFCMDGGAYDADGYWKPANGGLGMAHCIDSLNKIYGKNFIKY
jgi:3'-phosphoadenosine 5'-phosphosulfate sulfotransferase (PAPS reductase)/FAD synthetase